MATYSYAQLEQLWINAGGPKVLAPVAAAIAEAESGGNSDAYNPSGASGLWQILGDPQGVTGNPFDPGTNARMAVAKYRQAPGGGNNFSPWTTYTSGAYKAYLSGKTTPDPNVPGSSTATATLTAAQVTELAATAQNDCLWSIGFVNSNNSGPSAWGWIGAALHDIMNPTSPAAPTAGGEICIFRKSEMRGIAGIGLMVAGGLVMLPGIIIMAAAAGGRAYQAIPAPVKSVANLTPAGRAANSVGSALSSGRRPTRSKTKQAPAKPSNTASNTKEAQASAPTQGTVADQRGTSPEFRQQFGTA